MRVLTNKEVIEISREIAEQNGWPFEGRISIWRTWYFWFFGRRLIRVKSDADFKGQNVFITLHANTGEVLHKGFGGRL